MICGDKSDERLTKTNEYIEYMFQAYNDLLVIKLVLFYESPTIDCASLDKANEDIRRMLTNRNSKSEVFKDLVGYICKKEYTSYSGARFHVVFFYDAVKVKADLIKSQQIGKRWEAVTDDNVGYYNCNVESISDIGHTNPLANNGLGLVSRFDITKRDNLLWNTIAPLCLDDVSDNMFNVRGYKSFTRGQVTKSKFKATMQWCHK